MDGGKTGDSKNTNTWRDWSGDFQPVKQSQWAWPSKGINVDHGGLKKVSADIEAQEGIRDSRHLLPSGRGVLDHLELSSREVVELESLRVNIEYLFGQHDYHASEFRVNYAGLAAMFFVSAANYEAADCIFDEGVGLLRWAFSGNGVFKLKSSLEPSNFSGGSTDVDSWDANKVKAFFDQSEPDEWIKVGDWLTEKGRHYIDRVADIDDIASRTALAWPDETGELVLEALRKFHGSARALAYVASSAGEACTDFGYTYKNYKDNFDKHVDYRSGWFEERWEDLTGHEHNKARIYLQNFISEVWSARSRLPNSLETVLPRTPQQYFLENHEATGTQYGSTPESTSTRYDPIESIEDLRMSMFDEARTGNSPFTAERRENGSLEDQFVADASRDKLYEERDEARDAAGDRRLADPSEQAAAEERFEKEKREYLAEIEESLDTQPRVKT